MAMQNNIQQLREEFKGKVARLNDYLWGAGLKDPVTRIQQISFLFFLKMMEEQDIAMEKEEKLTGHKHQSIFAGKNEKFRWSRWREKTGNILNKFVRAEGFRLFKNLNTAHTKIPQVF